jgi:hypothetical protein
VIALLTGSLLAALALAFVFWPILKGASEGTSHPSVPERPRESSALEAMREIEFDRATGKLSTADYEALRARYGPEALRELDSASTAASAAPASPTADAAEQLIARLRATPAGACPSHGPRPESDALFCSECGRSLAA